jgi:hypothetical protein
MDKLPPVGGNGIRERLQPEVHHGNFSEHIRNFLGGREGGSGGGSLVGGKRGLAAVGDLDGDAGGLGVGREEDDAGVQQGLLGFREALEISFNSAHVTHENHVGVGGTCLLDDGGDVGGGVVVGAVAEDDVEDDDGGVGAGGGLEEDGVPGGGI